MKNYLGPSTYSLIEKINHITMHFISKYFSFNININLVICTSFERANIFYCAKWRISRRKKNGIKYKRNKTKNNHRRKMTTMHLFTEYSDDRKSTTRIVMGVNVIHVAPGTKPVWVNNQCVCFCVWGWLHRGYVHEFDVHKLANGNHRENFHITTIYIYIYRYIEAVNMKFGSLFSRFSLGKH